MVCKKTQFKNKDRFVFEISLLLFLIYYFFLTEESENFLFLENIRQKIVIFIFFSK
jgi:hypothetical protein